MAKVLVTGGCGYIGSHVVRELSKAGYDVVVFDNLSTGFADALTHGETLIKGDLADHAHLDRVVGQEGFDAVLHFAASIVVPESVSDPLSYYANNTGNLISLLQICQRHRLNKIIFSSTAAVYGNGDGETAFHEDLRPAPESPYGHSKFFSEQIIRDASRAGPLKHVILRYFNVAGADPELKIGQRSPNATHLIKIACETVVGKRTSMHVHGDDYDTRDGTCIRDFIHVTDLANAHVKALQYLEKGGESQTLNCGYGQGYSVKEVLAAIDEVAGIKVPRAIGPRRPGDAVVVLASCERIQKILGWKPQYDDIRTIVTHALAWERKMTSSHS